MPVDDLLTRHASLPRDEAGRDLPIMASQRTVVLSCMDHRADPADFLALDPGEAVVMRNAGGRVTDAVIRDLAYLQLLVRTFVDGPAGAVDVLVVHHTDCGSRALLIDEVAASFRAVLGDPELDTAAVAVADPTATLAADLERLRTDPRLTGLGTVRGGVYDTTMGRLVPVTG